MGRRAGQDGAPPPKRRRRLISSPCLSPSGLTRFGLAAKPAFPILGAYLRLPIMLLAGDMVDALAGVDRDVSFDVATAGAAEPTLWHEPGDSFKATWAHREKGCEGSQHQRKEVSQSPQPRPGPPRVSSPAVGLVRTLMTLDFAQGPVSPK